VSDFENRSRAALEASVAHLDGRVRSRLTRARHAALDELQRRRHRTAWWPLLPVATFGAAAVLAVTLWTQRPEAVVPREDVPVAQVAPAAGDEGDFLLGEDLFDAALAAEEPKG
jgi:hypothetical protein